MTADLVIALNKTFDTFKKQGISKIQREKFSVKKKQVEAVVVILN